jgi:hypothetical protein
MVKFASLRTAVGVLAAAVAGACGTSGGNSPEISDALSETSDTPGNTLGDECAAACQAQSALPCSANVASCERACIGAESQTENPSVSCVHPYDALAACEATLTHWACSMTSGNPIPAAGECTATVCAWACCVGSDIADPDIWTECMSSCG